jgi:hypothetical protein
VLLPILGAHLKKNQKKKREKEKIQKKMKKQFWKKIYINDKNILECLGNC